MICKMETAVAGATTKEILTNFAGLTSVHGVPRVILSRSCTVRCVWAVICIIANFFFFAQLYLIIKRYYQYPTDVSIKVIPMHVPFPAVTFCNMRNLDFTVLNTINRMFLHSSLPIDHVNKSKNPFINEYMAYLAKIGPMYDQSFNESIRNNDMDYINKFEDVFSTSTLAANIAEDAMTNASLQLDEFVVKCRFGGHSCNKTKAFRKFFDQRYFNCFTFHAPDEYTHELSGNKHFLSKGIESGLSVVVLTGSGMLDINESPSVIPGLQEAHSSVTFGDGVRIVIHPPDAKPFPLDEGYDVPPGYSASFAITPRRDKRLQLPYGNCTPTDEHSGKDEDQAQFDHHRYRAMACQQQCIQKHVISTCGCYEKSLPIPLAILRNNVENSVEKVESVSPCQQANDIPDSCMMNASQVCFEALQRILNRTRCMRKTHLHVKRDGSQISKCLCFPSCDEIRYGISYSISKYLGPGFGSDYSYSDLLLTSNIEETLKKHAKLRGMNMTRWEDDFNYFIGGNRQQAMKDFSRINVYIADSNVIQTTEAADYTSDQLISDIGGQLGIWIGVSVIGISELIELVLTLLNHSFAANRKGRQDHVTSSDGTDNRDAGGKGDKNAQELEQSKTTSA